MKRKKKNDNNVSNEQKVNLLPFRTVQFGLSSFSFRDFWKDFRADIGLKADPTHVKEILKISIAQSKHWGFTLDRIYLYTRSINSKVEAWNRQM